MAAKNGKKGKDGKEPGKGTITMHLQYSDKVFDQRKLLTVSPGVGYTISLDTVESLLKDGNTIYLTEWPNRHVDLVMEKPKKTIEEAVIDHIKLVRKTAKELEEKEKENGK